MTSPTTPTTPPPAPGKSLNVKFLVIALAALAVLVGGYAALDHTMRLRRDRQTIAWAEQAMAAGRYEDAAAQFDRSVARHPEDAGLSLKSGDAYYALSASKPEALQKARVAWEAAARLKPNDLPAFQRLLRFDSDLAEVHPVPAVFAGMGQVAQRVVAIEPSDQEAAIARTIARLGPWFAQTDPGTASEATAHDALVAALGDSVGQGHSAAAAAADPRVIVYYALASARRAVELRRAGQEPAAQQILDRARQQIESNPGAASDRDPQVLYRAAAGLTILADAYQRLGEPADVPAPAAVPTTQPATTQPAAARPQSIWPTWDEIDYHVKWEDAQPARADAWSGRSATTRPASPAATGCLQQARAMAGRAAAALAAADPHVVDVRLLEAHLAQAAGEPSAAEQIRRTTLAARPGSLRVQLALAESVSGAHPDQTIAILDQPEKADDAGPGPVALARRELLIRASQLRARLYLDAAANAADPVARQSNVDKANAACDKLAQMLVNDATSLKLTGRLRMLQGRYADAVRLLNGALMMPGGRGDLDLLSCRGGALVALHESQVALQSLRAALVADPSRLDDRLLLAQTLLAEGRITEAAEQVQLVDRQLGADPRALALRVRFLVASDAYAGDDATTGTALHDAYAKLPEVDLKQKITKAGLGLSAGEPADAIRLLRPAHPTDTSLIPVAADLARALIATGKPDEAGAALADALRQHPNEPTLLAVQKSIDGPASPEAYEATLTDPNAKDFLKAAHACREALTAHDLPKAKEQLDTMAQRRAEDPLLFDLKFRYDLATEQWADAGVCVDRLARANFDRAEGRTYAFRLDVARGHFIAAANVARQMTLRYGRRADGWIFLGQALQGVGRGERAIDRFNKALALEPNNVDAIKALAACLVSAGREAEANKWIAEGRRLAPADADLRELELNRQLAQGDLQRLKDAREKALRDEPQRPDNAIALARVCLQIARHDALSNPAGATDALIKATRVLADAIKQWPDDQDCSFWAAHAAALAGNLPADKVAPELAGGVPQGKQILRKLCDRLAWSRRPEAEQMLAEFCLLWADPQAAQVALRDAIARGAVGPQTPRHRADVLMRQGSWRAALDAIKPYPADLLAQQQRITIALGAGDAAAAERSLQAAHAADPSEPRRMTLLGLLYADARADAPAKSWLDRAFAAGDEELAARGRGELELRQRRPDLAAAARDLAVAAEANPADPGAAVLLSEALVRRHDAAGAARVLRAALAVMPSNTRLRLTLIALEREAAVPEWGRIASLIDVGRLQAPSDFGWDVAAAQMWSARRQPERAAALMRYAVRLAETQLDAADVTMKPAVAARLRVLLPDEFWTLLAAQANDAVLAEADHAIRRYGEQDMLAAWAHYARGAVNRRVARETEASDEYNTALSIAQAAGGYPAAASVIETISTESGADEAIRRINGYLAAVDAGRVGGTHDPQFDLLRVDLDQRKGDTHSAAAEIDKLMPTLDSMPDAVQARLLRMAVAIDLQDTPAPQYDKARAACAALLQRLPDDAWALNNMAVLSLEQASTPADARRKALDYAQLAYRAAGRDGPADPLIADTYGWALAEAGRPREAIGVLKGVASQLSIPDVQYHLAEAYLAGGDPQAAWPHLADALRMTQRDARQGARVDPFLRRGIATACWRVLREDAVQTFKPWRTGTPADVNAAESRNGTVN
jgi:predicted Zn-dependent protease